MTLAGGFLAFDGTNNALIVRPDATGADLFGQSGITTVSTLRGGTNTLRIDPLAVAFEGFTAPSTSLVLALGTGGVATGNINVAALQVQGSGGSTGLTGTVAGQTGFNAAYISGITPAFNALYLLNGCAIASGSCVPLSATQTDQTLIAPQSFLRPDILTWTHRPDCYARPG